MGLVLMNLNYNMNEVVLGHSLSTLGVRLEAGYLG